MPVTTRRPGAWSSVPRTSGPGAPLAARRLTSDRQSVGSRISGALAPRLWRIRGEVTQPIMYRQVTVAMPAVCKTVGSAYVGSNPTPATSFRRSKPVTLDRVTSFSRERERLRRPSAVVCGPCVGQIRLSAAAAC
jgi:hypothetical protein